MGKTAFDIDCFGPKLGYLLLDQHLNADYPDFFTLKVGDLLDLPRLGAKSAENLIQAIEKSRQITLPRFITSLSIPQVGEETADLLAQNFQTLDKISQADVLTLEKIEGIGPVVAEAICTWFTDRGNRQLLKKMLAKVQILKVGKTKNSLLSGQTIVFTGSLQKLSRAEAKNLARSLGAHPAGSVSTQTNLVVAGQDPGSKYDEAVRLGVKIISEDEFLQMAKWQGWCYYGFMIGEHEVESLAALARLSLSTEEKTKLHKDLESILGYISELVNVPVGQVEKQDLGLVKNVMREDGPPNDRKAFTADILAEAPRVKNGHLEVKKILDIDNG